MAIGTGGLLASGYPADLGLGVGLEVLAEDDVVRHHEAVEAAFIEHSGPFEQVVPAPGVGRREREEGGGELNGRWIEASA